MSREWEGDDYVSEGLWNGRVAMATRSRRGKAALRELRDALLALPEKRLLRHHLALDGQVCALGAWLKGKRCGAGEAPAAVQADLERYGDNGTEIDTLYAAQEAGMTFTLAWEIGQLNDYDGVPGETPEQTYARVLAWVDAQLALPGLGTAAASV